MADAIQVEGIAGINLISEKESAGVLLFHGLTGVPQEFLPTAQALREENFSVRAPLLVGHGSSLANLSQTTSKEWLSQTEQEFSQFLEGRTRIFVGGLSFGALLAIYLSSKYPEKVAGTILIAAPLLFRSTIRELVLNICAKLPDRILDLLPTVAKPIAQHPPIPQPPGAYGRHSIGAGARLVQIRKLLNLSSLEAPILHLYDPQDLHLSPSVPALLETHLKCPISQIPLDHAGHQLTIGPEKDATNSLILEFIGALKHP